MATRHLKADDAKTRDLVSRRAILATAGAAAALIGVGSDADAAGSTSGSSMPSNISNAFTWTQGLVSDFTKARALDTTIWKQGWFADTPSSVSGPINPNETTAYSSRNIWFDDSGIHLEVTNRPVGRWQHTGALITSHGLVSLTPGCWIEARMHLPGSGGRLWDWPGFWLNGYDDNERQWPQNGEIDVMEGLDDGYAAWHYHWGAQAGVATQNDGGNVDGSYTGWHTFAAHWQWGRIDYYYDSILVGSVTKNVQHNPHYMILGHSTSNRGNASSGVICSAVRSWTHG